MVHEVLKSTIANVRIFNGFLARHGPNVWLWRFKDPEEWWDASLPQFGIDSTLTAVSGGYKK